MQSERTVGVRYNSAMRAVLLHEFGGADKLVYEENVPESTVDSGEVKVRVRACALNHLDIWVRNGIPAYKTPLPHILGSDIAGEVVEVGSGVRGWGKGDEVILVTANGKGIRLRVADLRITGRIAQGVKLIDLAEGDTVAAITRIVLGKRLHEVDSARDGQHAGE